MVRDLVVGVAVAILATTPAVSDSGRLGVTQRVPTVNDGRPNYEPDMLWLDQNDKTWIMTDERSGHATWVFRDPAASIIDEIGGTAPLAAYGTRRLSSIYTAPALNLVRTSDSMKMDIGFLPSGELDESALGSFCARTECRVAIWYDQSGNRNDAAQTDPKSQPLIRLAHRTGNSLSVIWDYQATSNQPGRWLVLPPGLTVVDNAMAIMWTGRFDSASMMSPLLELGVDANPFNFGFWDAHGTFYIGTPDQLASVSAHAALSPSVGIISSSADEGIIINYRNNQHHQDALKTETHSGGFLGKTLAFHQSAMIELSSLVIYGRTLGADDRLHAIQALGEEFSIRQQQQDTLVTDGDSITQGLGSRFNQGYPWRLERLLPESIILYNAGWAAKTLAGTDGIVARYADFTARLFNPHARHNIISLLAGTNDIQNRSSGQDVYQRILAYAEAARHTGFKVVVSTILPRATFDTRMEYERIQANVLLRTNWRNFADGLADFAADPALGSANATSNPAIYISDGVHPTDYGYQIMAWDMAAVVSNLLEE